MMVSMDVNVETNAQHTVRIHVTKYPESAPGKVTVIFFLFQSNVLIHYISPKKYCICGLKKRRKYQVLDVVERTFLTDLSHLR